MTELEVQRFAPRRDRTLSSIVRRWVRAPARTFTILVTVLAITAGLYMAQPPYFEARADVVVVAIPSFSVQGTFADMSVDSAARLLTSDQVLGHVARELDYPGRSRALLNDLVISPVVNSRILRLYVRNEDADLARTSVDMLAREVLRVRGHRLERKSEQRLGEIEARLLIVDTDIARLRAATTASTTDPAELARLVRERGALESERAGIQTLPTEAGFVSRAATVGDRARRPYAPLYMGSGLAVGLCVAWLAAPAKRDRNQYLRRRSDDD